MFIGHFGVAFAAKRVAPRTSLGTTFVAAQLADLLWPILLLIGVEHVRMEHAERNPFRTLTFVDYPWSHGLASELVLGLLFGSIYFALTRYRRGALTIALLVPSHWLLDLPMHVRDLPLWPGGSARFGFGVWNYPALTVVLEFVIFGAGVIAYMSGTRARDRSGRFGLWILIVILVGLYVLSIISPPPPTVSALAWSALLGWPLTLLPWWVDRHRESR